MDDLDELIEEADAAISKGEDLLEQVRKNKGEHTYWALSYEAKNGKPPV